MEDSLITLLVVTASLQLVDLCHGGYPVFTADNASNLLDTLLEGYDRRLRPGFGGSPTEVDVNLNIRSMGPVSERDMAYQMDCYFRQSWVDTRLRFIGTGNLTTLPVSINILDLLWKPDTHFYNGKKSYLHTVTSPNKLLRIHEDGRILYSMRLTIKASCPMHLESFPMDVQTCPLRFGSHGYDTSEVVYTWTYGTTRSIQMAADMTLSQFDLIGFPQGNTTMLEPYGGTFSILFANFSLRRHMGYFLINIYVPCSLLVILSWVSFWINREATSDRIALGITTVLTMAFLGIDNKKDLPEVSYSTALDRFVGTCFAFVLVSIIQFAGVHFFTKHGSGEIQHDSDSDDSDWVADDSYVRRSIYSSSNNFRRRPILVTGKANGETTNVALHYSPEGATSEAGRPPREHCCTKFWRCLIGSASYRNMKIRTSRSGGINSVSRIDRLSRILFPVTFLVFNVVYWTMYLRGNASHLVL